MKQFYLTSTINIHAGSREEAIKQIEADRQRVSDDLFHNAELDEDTEFYENLNDNPNDI